MIGSCLYKSLIQPGFCSLFGNRVHCGVSKSHYFFHRKPFLALHLSALNCFVEVWSKCFSSPWCSGERHSGRPRYVSHQNQGLTKCPMSFWRDKVLDRGSYNLFNYPQKASTRNGSLSNLKSEKGGCGCLFSLCSSAPIDLATRNSRGDSMFRADSLDAMSLPPRFVVGVALLGHGE